MLRRYSWAVSVVALGCVSWSTTAAEAGLYSTTVLADNPLVYYRLDETTLSTATNLGTGTGLNGTYMNFGTGGGDGQIGAAGPRPTDLIGGIPLDGMDASNFAPHSLPSALTHVEVGDNAQLDLTGALTLEAWIKPDTVAGTGENRGIVSKYLGSGNQRSYNLLDSEGSLGLVLSPDGTFGSATQLSGSALSAGQWTHVVGTYVPSTSMNLYINGSLDATTGVGVPASLHSGTAPLWLATQFDSGTSSVFLDGLLDHVAVYDRALSSQEIAEHYSAAFNVVPEPSSFLLLGMGMLVLIRRTRRHMLR